MGCLPLISHVRAIRSELHQNNNCRRRDMQGGGGFCEPSESEYSCHMSKPTTACVPATTPDTQLSKPHLRLLTMASTQAVTACKQCAAILNIKYCAKIEVFNEKGILEPRLKETYDTTLRSNGFPRTSANNRFLNLFPIGSISQQS